MALKVYPEVTARPSTSFFFLLLCLSSSYVSVFCFFTVLLPSLSFLCININHTPLLFCISQPRYDLFSTSCLSHFKVYYLSARWFLHTVPEVYPLLLFLLLLLTHTDTHSSFSPLTFSQPHHQHTLPLPLYRPVFPLHHHSLYSHFLIATAQQQQQHNNKHSLSL